MRILALDHGTQRVGLALSDPDGILAQPLGYWPLEPFAAFVSRLRSLLVEKEVALVLVGMPRNMNGSYGPAAQRVEEFVGVLRHTLTVPVQTWDERLTSVQAQRLLIEGGMRRDRRKQKVDSVAAALLLQSYLESRTHRDNP